MPLLWRYIITPWRGSKDREEKCYMVGKDFHGVDTLWSQPSLRPLKVPLSCRKNTSVPSSSSKNTLPSNKPSPSITAFPRASAVVSSPKTFPTLSGGSAPTGLIAVSSTSTSVLPVQKSVVLSVGRSTREGEGSRVLTAGNNICADRHARSTLEPRCLLPRGSTLIFEPL